MWTSVGRVVVIAAACLLVVSGCETSTKLSGLFNGQRDDDTTATGSVESVGNPGAVVVAPDPVVNAANPRLAGQDPYDDLNLGKKYFRSANFGLAEKHFRRAVELHPGDAEAWLGLAASYDRLKRFDLADRAYAQAAALAGDTPEIMNNRGFSYILRGDYRRARRTLLAAQARAPDNPYIRNNIELLEKTQRRGKAIN